MLYEGDPWNMVVSRHDNITVVPPQEALPLLLVPTLPATGSEMNCCGVVTISFGSDGKLNSRPPVDRDDVRRVYELAI